MLWVLYLWYYSCSFFIASFKFYVSWLHRYDIKDKTLNSLTSHFFSGKTLKLLPIRTVQIGNNVDFGLWSLQYINPSWFIGCRNPLLFFFFSKFESLRKHWSSLCLSLQVNISRVYNWIFVVRFIFESNIFYIWMFSYAFGLINTFVYEKGLVVFIFESIGKHFLRAFSA